MFPVGLGAESLSQIMSQTSFVMFAVVWAGTDPAPDFPGKFLPKLLNRKT